MSMFNIVFWAALALTLIFLITAVVFFVRDRIWEVIAYFSGVKTGMRSAGHVRMSTVPQQSAPKKEKRTWRQGENIRGEKVTEYLGDNQATTPLQTEAATEVLTQPGATSVLEEPPVPGGTEVLASNPYATSGSITLDEEMSPEGGTVILDGTAAAPAVEGGTVILDDTAAAPAVEGGTVILSQDAAQDGFRIVEKILLVSSDEVIL